MPEHSTRAGSKFTKPATTGIISSHLLRFCIRYINVLAEFMSRAKWKIILSFHCVHCSVNRRVSASLFFRHHLTKIMLNAWQHFRVFFFSVSWNCHNPFPLNSTRIMHKPNQSSVRRVSIFTHSLPLFPCVPLKNITQRWSAMGDKM